MSAKQWLSRSLIVGPYITLVTSDEEFGRAMKHCKLERDGTKWIRTEQADATAHHIETSEKLICIVAIRVKPGFDGIQVASLLVHEAVHIWQRYCQYIGEHSPSDEFEAYSVQAISQELMNAYAKRLA